MDGSMPSIIQPVDQKQEYVEVTIENPGLTDIPFSESGCSQKHSETEDEDSGPTRKKKKSYKQTFKITWINKDNASWLTSNPRNAKEAYCLLCTQTIKGGITHLNRHAKSVAHVRRTQEIKLNAKLTTKYNRSIDENGEFINQQSPIIRNQEIATPSTPAVIFQPSPAVRNQNDGFGEYVSERLRALPVAQQSFVRKLISDAIFLGENDCLNMNSTIVTHTTIHTTQ